MSDSFDFRLKFVVFSMMAVYTCKQGARNTERCVYDLREIILSLVASFVLKLVKTYAQVIISNLLMPRSSLFFHPSISCW